MFENKNFQSWFKENTPKEGLSETTTFSKQFVKDAWDNGYYVGYNKAKKVQVVEHFEAYGQCRDSRRIASLEEENAELKEQHYADCELVDKTSEIISQLNKAKEIIKELLFISNELDENTRSKAEQFLKEIKENDKDN